MDFEKKSLVTIQEENEFEIQVEELKEVSNKYMQREHGSDDIDYLVMKGGYWWLQKGLATDFKNGLTEDDFVQWEKHFGHNRTDPIKIPSFF